MCKFIMVNSVEGCVASTALISQLRQQSNFFIIIYILGTDNVSGQFQSVVDVFSAYGGPQQRQKALDSTRHELLVCFRTCQILMASQRCCQQDHLKERNDRPPTRSHRPILPSEQISFCSKAAVFWIPVMSSAIFVYIFHTTAPAPCLNNSIK